MAQLQPWLTYAPGEIIRVKWRDDEGDLCEKDFATEAEARAFGGTFLRFLPSLEMGFFQMGEIMKRNPQMSPEEAMKAAGFEEVDLDAWRRSRCPHCGGPVAEEVAPARQSIDEIAPEDRHGPGHA